MTRMMYARLEESVLHDGNLVYTRWDYINRQELMLRDPEISCFAPIPLQPRPRPPVIPPAAVIGGMDNSGGFYVQDVYTSQHATARTSQQAAGGRLGARCGRGLPETVETPSGLLPLRPLHCQGRVRIPSNSASTRCIQD